MRRIVIHDTKCRWIIQQSACCHSLTLEEENAASTISLVQKRNKWQKMEWEQRSFAVQAGVRGSIEKVRDVMSDPLIFIIRLLWGVGHGILSPPSGVRGGGGSSTTITPITPMTPWQRHGHRCKYYSGEIFDRSDDHPTHDNINYAALTRCMMRRSIVRSSYGTQPRRRWLTLPRGRTLVIRPLTGDSPCL